MTATMSHFLATIIFETNPKLDFDRGPDMLSTGRAGKLHWSYYELGCPQIEAHAGGI